jgi:coatomer protein complex subunit epsilon
MEHEGLRSLRNYYYLGLFKQLQEEAESVRQDGDPDLAPLVDVYVNRAQLEVDPKKVFKSISDTAATGLQAVKLLGTYRTASDENKELVFETLNEWLSDEVLAQDDTLQILGAQIYHQEGRMKEALKLLNEPGENLEKLAMQVQLYLKINRPDLAERVIKQMADVDDDDPLTQLATTWVYIEQGGEKPAEAVHLLQELLEKFGPSVRVLNLLAVCQMHAKDFKRAFDYLKQARTEGMNSEAGVSPTTLVNTIVTLQYLGKSADVIAKITAELRELAPTHAWLKEQADMDSLFSKHAEKYS